MLFSSPIHTYWDRPVSIQRVYRGAISDGSMPVAAAGVGVTSGLQVSGGMYVSGGVNAAH